MKENMSLDGLTRKRIYLFRHGEVNYMPSGKVVADPNLVDLTCLLYTSDAADE